MCRPCKEAEHHAAALHTFFHCIGGKSTIWDSDISSCVCTVSGPASWHRSISLEDFGCPMELGWSGSVSTFSPCCRVSWNVPSCQFHVMRLDNSTWHDMHVFWHVSKTWIDKGFVALVAFFVEGHREIHYSAGGMDMMMCIPLPRWVSDITVSETIHKPVGLDS